MFGDYKRKRQARKLIGLYELEFQREIPAKAVARESLVELKRLNLLDLATQFDMIRGWEFLHGEIRPKTLQVYGEDFAGLPTGSRYAPCSTSTTPSKNLIQLKLRQVRHATIVKHYIVKPNYAEGIKIYHANPLDRMYTRVNPSIHSDPGPM